MERVIIGIDPDVDKSGVCVYKKDSNNVELMNMSFPELVEYMHWIDFADVYVEAGWINHGNWHLKGYDNKRLGASKGYDVGRNHETGRKIVEMLKYMGFNVKEVKPLRKCWKGNDGKITHEELSILCKAKGIDIGRRSNQDARDAALICLVSGGII